MKSISNEQINEMRIGQVMKRLNSNLIEDYDNETIEALNKRKNELRPHKVYKPKPKKEIQPATQKQIDKLFWANYKRLILSKSPHIDKVENYKSECRLFCDYLGGSKDFENFKPKDGDTIKFLNEPSLYKGICLIGSFGIGKSIYLECMNLTRSVEENNIIHYIPNRIESEMLTSHNIVDRFDDDKILFESYKKRKTLIIDDFGYEKKNYGNNELAGLIHSRHNKKLKTHISTNFIPEDIIARYGQVTFERIKEMCNIIVINRDKSLRK